MMTHFSTIHTRMMCYGGLFGMLGGGFLGAGFVALTYSPFYEMNILLIFVGTLATMLVGLAFGSVSGLLSGIGIALMTRLFLNRPTFRSIYRLLAIGLTAGITVVIFFQMAYLVGRPFIYDSPANLSWVWALLVSLVGALIASTLTTSDIVICSALKIKR